MIKQQVHPSPRHSTRALGPGAQPGVLTGVSHCRVVGLVSVVWRKQQRCMSRVQALIYAAGKSAELEEGHQSKPEQHLQE